MRLLKRAAVVALAALWAGAVLAQGPENAGHASHMDSLAILLDLSDAQKAQMQTILQAEHAQMRQLFEQAKAAGTKPDFESMHAAHQQINQDTLQKLSAVLSPTQLKKFETLQQMHEHMMHHGFGHHGGPGGAGSAPAPSGPSN
jgi:Spy/CpxP family protein refolding chaperone